MASRTHAELLSRASHSTIALKAVPAKLDIKCTRQVFPIFSQTVKGEVSLSISVTGRFL